MKTMKLFRAAVVCFGIMTVLCGAVYTAAVTGAAQLLFPDQAGGSMIVVAQKDGTQKEYGSQWLAQEFTKPGYLIGRPSGVSNLSPVSEEQQKLVLDRISWWHSLDPDNQADIPMDLVTASGSGVDPHISPEAAEYQVARIAAARDMTEEEVRSIIKTCTKERFLGFIGEPAVNVLEVNFTLDGLLQAKKVV
ncbi:potassium-transporting ATPase subunit C [Lacrimispora sp.]|uniref:potassium-transporting ATPase subunit C n=1 Tax=Lacrimispora sp. TaxID=2719234 RepID=UPI00289D58B1|nr:potassium-transporting ATPase subunit C [Lacrimispora sp.]